MHLLCLSYQESFSLILFNSLAWRSPPLNCVSRGLAEEIGGSGVRTAREIARAELSKYLRHPGREDPKDVEIDIYGSSSRG